MYENLRTEYICNNSFVFAFLEITFSIGLCISKNPNIVTIRKEKNG